MKSKLHLGLASAMLTVAALAAAPHGAKAWDHVDTRITGVQVWNDGHAVVRFADWTGDNDCGSVWFSLGTISDPQQKGMLQIALAAYLSGRSVSVTTLPGSCQGHEERIERLEVY